MKSICSAIKVNNLVESLNFYIDGIGYSEYKRLSPNKSTSLVFLKDDANGLLELISIDDREKQENTPDNSMSLVIAVDNLTNALLKLKQIGYKPKNEPFKVPSGEIIAFINDPNGVEVELIENFIV